MKTHCEPFFSKVFATRVESKLSNYNGQMALLFRYMLETGLTISAASKLRMRDMANLKTVHVEPESKTGNDYYVELSEELYTRINNQCKNLSNDDFLFYGKQPNMPICRSSFQKALRNAVLAVDPDKADLITPMSLRKTFFLRYYEKTSDIRDIMKYTGHHTSARAYSFLCIADPTHYEPHQENATAREKLLKDKAGEDMIASIIDSLQQLPQEMYNPLNPDYYYETLYSNLKTIKDFLDCL